MPHPSDTHCSTWSHSELKKELLNTQAGCTDNWCEVKLTEDTSHSVVQMFVRFYNDCQSVLAKFSCVVLLFRMQGYIMVKTKTPKLCPYLSKTDTCYNWLEMQRVSNQIGPLSAASFGAWDTMWHNIRQQCGDIMDMRPPELLVKAQNTSTS